MPFDIGFWELALMAVIGLIVLGPERLPRVARTLGSWVGRAKGYVRGLTDELEREIDVADLRTQVREAREQIESGSRQTADGVRRVFDEAADNNPDAESEQAPPPAAERASEKSAHDDAPANPVAEAAPAADDAEHKRE